MCALQCLELSFNNKKNMEVSFLNQTFVTEADK